MTGWLRRVRARIRYRQFHRDLQHELDVHRAMAEDANIAGGATADDARRDAVRTLGNVTLARESARAVWISPWLESVWQDLRYAARVLRKRPGFTLAVVATLTLGIGLNTAFFTVFNAATLRPWPAADPDRVVLVSPRSTPDGSHGFTPAEVDAIGSGSSSFSHLASFGSPWAPYIRTTASGEAHHDAFVGVVSTRFFEVLGRPMALGRGFHPDDDGAGSPRVAIISYSTWQRRFGGDPNVLGRSLYLNNDPPFTIIGVAARGVHAPMPHQNEAWVLRSGFDASRSFTSNSLLVGRLAPGANRQTAAAELASLLAHARTPDEASEPRGVTITSTSPAEYGSGGIGRYLPVQAALAIVLLLACLNVANLLLARALARQGEISLRLSLGAGRARLVRQLMTEAAMLTGLAAACACAAAYVALRLSYTYLAPNLINAPWTIDANVLWFTGGTGVLCVLLCGLAPALQGTRSVKLLMTSAGAVTGRARTRFRSVALAAQVAFSASLLVAASLLTRGLLHASTSVSDFDLDGVAIARVTIPDAWAPDASSAFRLDFMTALERSRLWPAGIVDHEPLERVRVVTRVRVPDQPDTSARTVHVQPMSIEGLQVLRLQLSTGRAYDDGPGSTEVVVNETLARRFWPSGEAIGQTLIEQGHPYTVVGVVRDAHFASFETMRPIEPTLYRPPSAGALTMIARGSLPEVRGEIGAILQTLDSRVTAEVVPLSDKVEEALSDHILAARAAWSIGTIGLVLAALGVFGMFAYMVEARRRDIGIRLALGARPRQVLASVFETTRWSLVGGLVAGLLLSVAGGLVLQQQLFGLSPLDPIAYGLALAILLAAALVATFIPARRAMRVDPAVTLRAE